MILSNFLMAQSVYLDSIKINDSIPVKLNFKKLISYKNLVDSITPIPEIMDASYADSLIYIGKSYFEYYSYYNEFTEKNCSMGDIKLEGKIKSLTINSIKLSGETTFEQMKLLFPIDCTKLTPMNINGEERLLMVCGVSILLDNGELADNHLDFYFHNNKLVIISLFHPT